VEGYGALSRDPSAGRAAPCADGARTYAARVLEEMRIRSLGVIADAVLDLHPGFTVVTGETGAGKTMVVQSLTLLAGGRADSGLVRPGEPRAVVEGRLRGLDPPAVDRALAAGAELDDDGGLLVSRAVTAEGRSRAYVGGAAVPVGVLAAVVGDAVTVHGQHDQQRLLRPTEQRAALDRSGGAVLAEVAGTYTALWQRWRAADEQLRELTTRARERGQEAEVLRLGLERVAAVEAQPGEDQALAREAERLRNAGDLRAAAAGAHAALAGDPLAEGDSPDVQVLLAGARRALGTAAAHDQELEGLGRRVAELAYLAADAAADLSAYAASIEDDPLRLAAVEERRAALSALARSYGPGLDDVAAWAQAAAVRLAELDGDDDRRDDLVVEVEALAGGLGAAAVALRAARVAAATVLAEAVGVELAALAMPHARVTVTVTPTAPGPDGADDVELLLAPHPGAPARPLARGASGGELSRVMLALEVVCLGPDSAGTLVFDEVDAGVGGRAAVEVGRRLARLASGHQVVCVTHLPQVAAFADRHLRVVKSDDGTVTESGVELLGDVDRVRELSRMLAGLDDSELARGHAEELLAAAAEARRG